MSATTETAPTSNKKLSCCCDSRSYCVQRTDKLSNRLRLQA